MLVMVLVLVLLIQQKAKVVHPEGSWRCVRVCC
jgi:hypothetical protein